MTILPALSLPQVEKHVFAKAHLGPIHVARWNTLGRYVLTGGQDRQIKLWNGKNGPAEDGKPIKVYSAHSHEVLAIDISKDNSRFASGGNDKAVFLWDVASGAILRRFTAHAGKINDVRISGSHADGSVLVTGGFDAVVRVYDLRAQGAWKPIMEMKEAKDAIMALTVTDSVISSGSVDGVARTYDMRAGELRTDVLDYPVTSLSITSDGQSYLASTLDSTHRLMDMSDGSLLQSFQGHTNESYRCHSVLAQNEAVVLSGDEQGRICAWDMLNGQQVSVAGGSSGKAQHQKSVLWVEESPAQGDHDVLSAGADGVLKIWSES